MVTRFIYWLAYLLNHLNPWGYQKLIRNRITLLFLKYCVLPAAILVNRGKMIRDVLMRLKIEHIENMAETLVDAGVPLRLVVDWARPDMVRMMLYMSNTPNGLCHDSITAALHVAVQKGDYRLQIARTLLKCGANVHAVDKYGYTPLQRTLRLRYPILRMVKLLVSRGARVKGVSHTWNGSPLLTAVTFNQPLSVVKFLVKHGANPNEERSEVAGETVLHRASVHQRSDLIDYFLHLGMDVNVRSELGLNLISRQVMKDCSYKFFKFLIRHNAVVDNNVLRWMLDTSTYIKYADSKLRLYILNTPMEMNRTFYPAGLTQALSKLNYCPGRVSWGRPILEMLALREFLTDSVDWGLVTQNYMLMHRRYGKYFLECKKELQRMKLEKLHREVTMLNLLSDDVTKVGRYLRNRKIVKTLVKTDFKNMYATYGVYLVHKLRHVKEQFRLKEKTAAQLAQLHGLDPHDLCVTKIVSFLKPEDMRMFLSCFEHESKSDEQKRT